MKSARTKSIISTLGEPLELTLVGRYICIVSEIKAVVGALPWALPARTSIIPPIGESIKDAIIGFNYLLRCQSVKDIARSKLDISYTSLPEQ